MNDGQVGGDQGDQIGRMFTLGRFFENTYVAALGLILGNFFLSYVLTLTKNVPILGNFLYKLIWSPWRGSRQK
jgi:hypothetical protein